MATYTLRRFAQLPITLLLTSIAIFSLIHLIPGDPAYTILGPDATPEQIVVLRAEMGLGQPLPVQYAIWLGRALTGDLGKSFISDFPVAQLVLARVPVTLQLALASLAIALVIALVLGTLSATHRGLIDRAAVMYSTTVMAIPTFWLALVLILIFSARLRLLPPSGYAPLTSDVMAGLRYLLLPATALGLYLGGVLTRFVRATLIDVLAQDYVRTARAKGLREISVVLGHALRSALVPLVTVVAVHLGTLLSGAVIAEEIFDYPGLGRLLLQAMLKRDYTVVQGTILFVTTAFALTSLAADLAYGALDPRVRLASSGISSKT